MSDLSHIDALAVPGAFAGSVARFGATNPTAWQASPR